MSRESKEIIVGLDIGTTKVVALVAEVSPDDRLNIIGMGSQDSRGLKKGVVVNIEDTVATISRVIQEVELMADCKVKDVYTGIAGSHIRSFNSNGMVAIKDKEVNTTDVERVIETARAMPIPADQEILHILTQEFIIDDQDGIREPIGMSGFRLEVKVHIVTGAVSAAQNIVKCVRRCGLEVNDLVLQPLASSYAVLSEDEKDLGVCLIDIGGGTTDLAVWTQGAIRHTSVIPIAGDQITNDIAMALRTPTREAEDIKCFNSNGMVAIKDKEVTTMDVERVIETARAMPIPADQEILHILTQEFVIDGQDGIREPIGMSGMRLEVKTHIVTGAVSGIGIFWGLAGLAGFAFLLPFAPLFAGDMF